MSAFMVSNETMNRVVCALDQIEQRNWSCEQLEWLGNELYAMNARACQSHYPSRAAELYIPPFDYHPKWSYSKFEMLKAVDCLIYQCSEGDVPEEVNYAGLKKLQNRLRSDIIHAIPEYAAAAWDNHVAH